MRLRRPRLSGADTELRSLRLVPRERPPPCHADDTDEHRTLLRARRSLASFHCLLNVRVDIVGWAALGQPLAPQRERKNAAGPPRHVRAPAIPRPPAARR